jgi:hypothetical protein
MQSSTHLVHSGGNRLGNELEWLQLLFATAPSALPGALFFLVRYRPGSCDSLMEWIGAPSSLPRVPLPLLHTWLQGLRAT